MGLFNIFKSKNKSETKINGSRSLGEMAEKLAKEGAISVLEDDNHNSFGEKLDKLVDGELPWGWVSAKYDFIKPRDTNLVDLRVKASKANSIKEEKPLIEEFLNEFYKYKQECESKGECYIKYFSDMHEHCHNSKNSDFSFAAPMEERLHYINENYNALVEAEEKKKNLLANLDDRIEIIIRTNSGILQSDLIKKFDPIIKGEVSDTLYQWDKIGRIERIKNGRSYSVKMK